MGLQSQPNRLLLQKQQRMLCGMLSDNAPPVNHKTGRLHPDAKLSLLWKGVQARGDCSIGSLASDFSLNPAATLKQRYEHAQVFSVFNLCVSPGCV
jgi:hypothetical protein